MGEKLHFLLNFRLEKSLLNPISDTCELIVHQDRGEYDACFSMWGCQCQGSFTPVIPLQKCNIEACNVKSRQVRIFDPAHMASQGIAPVAVADLSYQWPDSPTMGVVFLLLVSSFAYANAVVI